MFVFIAFITLAYHSLESVMKLVDVHGYCLFQSSQSWLLANLLSSISTNSLSIFVPYLFVRKIVNLQLDELLKGFLF